MKDKIQEICNDFSKKDIFDNKVKKGFNTTDVELEFCFTYGELAEAFDAYRKK
jgi:hypothetical protein